MLLKTVPTYNTGSALRQRDIWSGQIWVERRDIAGHTQNTDTLCICVCMCCGERERIGFVVCGMPQQRSQVQTIFAHGDWISWHLTARVLARFRGLFHGLMVNPLGRRKCRTQNWAPRTTLGIKYTRRYLDPLDCRCRVIWCALIVLLRLLWLKLGIIRRMNEWEAP